MQYSWPGNSCVTAQNQASVIFLRSTCLSQYGYTYIRIHLHQCDLGCRVLKFCCKKSQSLYNRLAMILEIEVK